MCSCQYYGKSGVPNERGYCLVCGGLVDPARSISTAPSYTCPRCGFVSFNPNDLTHRYCVMCHRFEQDEEPPA